MITLSATFKWIFDTVDINIVIDFVMVLVLLVLINIVLNFFVRRKVMLISTLLSTIFFLISYVLCLTGLMVIASILITVIAFTGLFINMAELRSYFNNGAKAKENLYKDKKKEKVNKIFDHNQLYKTINDVVTYFSKNKIGAIMSFERKDDLTDIIENGSELDCPVTYDLLLTIFYPGTRLHDGAVIIRGNRIIAASVLYKLSTKPMAGKFGSRHRAAIGISEISDSVTVVVSEETGRISIVYNGEIQSYSLDTFLNAFSNLMSSTSTRIGE